MYEILILTFLVIVIFVSNYYVMKLGDKHYTDNTSCELYDMFHEILPDLTQYHFIVDLILLSSIVSLFFLSNETLTTEFLAKFVIIMFIRAFTTLVTILPKHENCDSKLSLRSFILGGCYDKIFSGHTSFTLLLTLLYYREHIIGLVPMLGINLLNILAILSVRSHYSVDVLLAIFVTTTIYSIKV